MRHFKPWESCEYMNPKMGLQWNRNKTESLRYDDNFKEFSNRSIQ